MGWSSGTEVMDGLIKFAKKHVPEENRKAFYLDVIGLLENHDWDTQQESLGKDPFFDEAYEELYPDEGPLTPR